MRTFPFLDVAMTTTASAPLGAEVDERSRRRSQLLKERGNSFYVRHQFAQAIDFYTQAIDANPAAYDVYTNRAAAHAALKMFEEGLADAEEAVRLRPDWAKGHWRAGTCLVCLGRNKEAAVAFERGLESSPDSEQMRSELERVRSVLRAAPSSAEEAKRRGNDHFRDGSFERAISMYREALSLLDEEGGDVRGGEAGALRAALLVNTAECQRQLGEYEEVARTCGEALEILEELGEDSRGRSALVVKAHLRRGLALERMEDYSRARLDFKRSIEMEPTNHIASAGLVRCAKAEQVRQKRN